MSFGKVMPFPLALTKPCSTKNSTIGVTNDPCSSTTPESSTVPPDPSLVFIVLSRASRSLKGIRNPWTIVTVLELRFTDETITSCLLRSSDDTDFDKTLFVEERCFSIFARLAERGSGFVLRFLIGVVVENACGVIGMSSSMDSFEYLALALRKVLVWACL